LAKKQKTVKLKHAPTKRQLSRWQRERKTRRIVISIAVAFLACVVGYVLHGFYDSEVRPFREVAIEVNDVSFDMGYYVDMLEAQTKGVDPTYVYYQTDWVAMYIEDAELMRQEAEKLGILVTGQEINEKIEEYELPNSKAYRDIVGADLLMGKLQEHFASQLPEEMEQAHIQVILVESEQVANDVVAAIEGGGNFTVLAEEFSSNPQVEGDLGWLPQELMPNSLIGDAVFSPEASELCEIGDESATKNVGYWLIEVTDKDEEKGIRARAILLGSEVEAEEVRVRLASGNFTALAREHSQHESKDDGGELGWLKKGNMTAAFDQVAFDLHVNEVSEPVKDEEVTTKGGYWIVQILDKGEQELSEGSKKRLADKDLEEWLRVSKENSKVVNHLDESKKLWAVEIVLERR
jgi:parvulin-like peptidyl-prolyl isomerase